jgi:LacI family transcriptional regulator
MPKVNLADVARSAGVSIATVDRVLNSRGNVSREKEALVLKWARALKLDRSLSTVSARWLRVAILMHKPSTQYYIELKQGFEHAQRVFEAQRIICVVTYFDDLGPEKVIEVIKNSTRRADALIIATYEHPSTYETLKKISETIPIVTLGSDLPNSGRNWYVGLDNWQAGRTAGELMGRFLGLSGGEILPITGLNSLLSHKTRESGFRAVLKERFPSCIVIETVESRLDPMLMDQLTCDAFAKHPNLKGIYNISNGDQRLAATLRRIGRATETVYINHGLDDTSREDLINGTLDAVILHNAEIEAIRCIEMVLRHYHRFPSLDPPQQIPVTILIRESLPKR